VLPNHGAGPPLNALASALLLLLRFTLLLTLTGVLAGCCCSRRRLVLLEEVASCSKCRSKRLRLMLDDKRSPRASISSRQSPWSL
jgi:hypothetical protein